MNSIQNSDDLSSELKEADELGRAYDQLNFEIKEIKRRAFALYRNAQTEQDKTRVAKTLQDILGIAE